MKGKEGERESGGVQTDGRVVAAVGWWRRMAGRGGSTIYGQY